jgi:hypothetical protein
MSLFATTRELTGPMLVEAKEVWIRWRMAMAYIGKERATFDLGRRFKEGI